MRKVIVNKRWFAADWNYCWVVAHMCVMSSRFHRKLVLRNSKDELRCRDCGEFLPDKFKTIAVMYGLPIEANFSFDIPTLKVNYNPWEDEDESK